MADQQQVIPPNPEIIRHQMEQTRSSLTEKLEVLEKKVTDTVQEATEAVSDTVESVKETVTETVEAVKDTVSDTVGTVQNTVQSTVTSVCDALNLSDHVRQHPLAMVGGSMALGFLGGLALGPAPGRTSESPRRQSRATVDSEPAAVADWTPPATREPVTRGRSSEPGLWDRFLSTFGSEIDKLKGMAIGTLGSVVRDLATQAVPERFHPMVTDLIKDVTTKLGGEMVPGPVLPEREPGEGSHCNVRATSFIP